MRSNSIPLGCARRVLWVLVVGLSLLYVAQAPAADRLFDFKETRLENGLHVITLEDFSCPIVAVQVWYHVGSKNEDPNRRGFTHMFEHMMFRGTDRLGPEKHFELIRRTGGNANAFTSFDVTSYVNEVPSNQLELPLWLEAERMMFLKVDQESFDTERKVVEEERRQDLNEPYGTVVEEVLPVIFHQHPYRWTPIGKIAHLRAASLEELQRFWDAYYVPANATVIIAGAVKHREAQRFARRYFGWMPKATLPDAAIPQEPPQTAPREAVVQERLGPAPLAGFIYRGVPENHPDMVSLEVLMGVLGYGDSSRLYRDLVQERKLCAQVLADVYGFEQDGVFGAGAALLPGNDPEPVLKAIQEHLERLVHEPVGEREIEKVKNQLRRNLVTTLFTVASKARQLGYAALLHGDPDWLNRQLDEIDAVTAADLQRVARSYIVPERRTTLRVLPARDAAPPADEEEAPKQPASFLADHARVKAGVTRPTGFPNEPPLKPLLDMLPQVRARDRTLPNGMEVVVIPNHEVPFVWIMLGLKYGAWTEEPSAAGTASVALAMLTKGTERYSAAKLAETLEFNAITLDGSADRDVAQVAATCLAEKLPIALELLAEVVLRPTFPVSEFQILKEQCQLSLSVRAKDPSYLADRELYRRLYGEHPYARPVEGDLNTLKRLEAGMAAKWWRTYARPDHAVLYVAGDVKPRDVFKLAQHHLGEWRCDAPAPEPVLAAIPPAEPTHIYVVDTPGAVQSQIRLGQATITRGHPDYHATRVFTQIFGGSFGSRLNSLIRVQQGLTYAASGGFIPYRFSGTFLVDTFTKTATTADAVRALMDVVSGMRTNPPTDDEMNTAKSYLTGSFAGHLETPPDDMAYRWIIEYNGLPKNYLKQALAAYKAADPSDLTRIATDILHTNKFVVVVVGDAAAIQANLQKIAPVTVVKQATE